jgi:arylsulfatase A-like enzyme
VDANLGRLIRALRASGQWQNTLVVFTSDHGEQMGDQGLVGKLGPFEESFHVPLIVVDPSADAALRGHRVDSFSESVDLMPTLLDWLDLPIPPQCEGASLLTATRGAMAAPQRDTAHWEFDFRGPDAQQALGLAEEQCRLSVRRRRGLMEVAFSHLPPLRLGVAA